MYIKPKWLVAGAVVVIASLVMSTYAVFASQANTALAAGTTRYYVRSYSPSFPEVNYSTTFVDVPGAAQSVTVPAGKTADAIITFCAEVDSDSAMMVRAVAGGAVAGPAETQIRLRGYYGGQQNQCVNFFRVGLKAGTRIVKVQWLSPDTQQQTMATRSMVVILNIH